MESLAADSLTSLARSFLRTQATNTSLAITDESRSLSVAEVCRDIGLLVERLPSSSRKQLIALVCDDSCHAYVGLAAIIAAGHAFLPIERSWPSDRVEAALSQTGAETMLSFDGSWRVDPVVKGAEPPANFGVLADRMDDVAYVVLTSGTSGAPKPVIGTISGVMNTVEAVVDQHAIEPGDAILSTAPFTFDLAFFDVIGGLLRGVSVVKPNRRSVSDGFALFELAQRRSCSVLNAVPTVADLLVTAAELSDNAQAPSLPLLRLALVSGDWIPPELPERFVAETGGTFVSLGGATEASIWSIWWTGGKVPSGWPSVPYGNPMPGQAITVVDESIRPVDDGLEGEIVIGGKGVALGYAGAPQQSVRAFIESPSLGRVYRTGDLGRVDPETGWVEIRGRMDARLKVGGFRVDPVEVERALERAPGVRRAAVVRRGSQFSAGVLVAHLEADSEEAVSAARLVASRELPDYCRPRAYVKHDRLPVSENGKLDRSSLAD